MIEELLFGFGEGAAPAEGFGVRVDHPDVDLHLVAAGLYFAGDNGANLQRLADFLRRLVAVLEFPRRLVCDDDEVLQRLQFAGQRGDQTVAQVLGILRRRRSP